MNYFLRKLIRRFLVLNWHSPIPWQPDAICAALWEQESGYEPACLDAAIVPDLQIIIRPSPSCMNREETNPMLWTKSRKQNQQILPPFKHLIVPLLCCCDIFLIMHKATGSFLYSHYWGCNAMLLPTGSVALEHSHYDYWGLYRGILFFVKHEFKKLFFVIPN